MKHLNIIAVSILAATCNTAYAQSSSYYTSPGASYTSMPTSSIAPSSTPSYPTTYSTPTITPVVNSYPMPRSPAPSTDYNLPQSPAPGLEDNFSPYRPGDFINGTTIYGGGDICFPNKHDLVVKGGQLFVKRTNDYNHESSVYTFPILNIKPGENKGLAYYNHCMNSQAYYGGHPTVISGCGKVLFEQEKKLLCNQVKAIAGK